MPTMQHAFTVRNRFFSTFTKECSFEQGSRSALVFVADGVGAGIVLGQLSARKLRPVSGFGFSRFSGQEVIDEAQGFGLQWTGQPVCLLVDQLSGAHGA